jgi:hypothetical protein
MNLARCPYGADCLCDNSCQVGEARQGRTEAQAQAFAVLLHFAEAGDPALARAFGALCDQAAFLTTNQAAADVLRLASRRLMAAVGESR